MIVYPPLITPLVCGRTVSPAQEVLDTVYLPVDGHDDHTVPLAYHALVLSAVEGLIVVPAGDVLVPTSRRPGGWSPGGPRVDQVAFFTLRDRS